MDNNNLNETPVEETKTAESIPNVTATTEEVTYNYDDAAFGDNAEGAGKGLSIAGLILGICSILCCPAVCLNTILGIVGLILSIVAKKKQAAGPSTVGLILNIVGIVLSIISLVVWIILVSMGVIGSFQ